MPTVHTMLNALGQVTNILNVQLAVLGDCPSPWYSSPAIMETRKAG